jgi:translocator protein
MNWTAIYMALGLCTLSIIFEVFGVSKQGKIWFENLRQPKYSFPFWIWYFIGGLYYLICGIVAYRIFLFKDESTFALALILLIALMFINGLTNYILFKLRSLGAFYFAIFPFSIITISLFIVLLRLDELAAWVLFPYVLWLLYDVYYFHFLWKMNKSTEKYE